MTEKETVEKINFSQTSYILGVISLITAFFTPLLGLVIGVVGLIQSRRANNKVSKLARKLNIAGMIVSIVIFIITIVLVTKTGALQNFPL